MRIIHADKQATDLVAALEKECFLPAEAASYERIADRIAHFGDHFWILYNNEEKPVGYVGGMVSSLDDLTDEMYADASMHDEHGDWQMIFSVCTLPAYRKKGYARTCLLSAIDQARAEGRRGVVLTCKAHLIHFYESCGFTNEGKSASEHGGAEWYRMRLTF